MPLVEGLNTHRITSSSAEISWNEFPQWLALESLELKCYESDTGKSTIVENIEKKETGHSLENLKAGTNYTVRMRPKAYKKYDTMFGMWNTGVNFTTKG